MKVNRITFGKMMQEWEANKLTASLLRADEIINAQFMKERGEEKLTPRPDPFADMNIAFEDETGKIHHMDVFGNPLLSDREKKQKEIDDVIKLGNKLLAEEKYELMDEAKQLYEKLKKELDRLNGAS